MFQFESETHLHLKRSIAALLTKELPRFDRPELYGTVPRELFTLLGDLGLAGLSIPEGFGGSQPEASIDVITGLIAVEELAYGNLGPAIFTCVHNMVAGLISKHGTGTQKARYLPRMATGELLGAFALTEPRAGSDAASLSTSAQRDPANTKRFKLNGEKCYITSAGSADLYLVFARTGAEGGKGISCFIVERNAAGLTVSKPDHKMGCELSPIASLNFDQVSVDEAQMLGSENGGYSVALSGLAGGRVSIAACANGVARRALDIALGSIRERNQFGSTIGTFQGIQFMVADLAMSLEAAQLLTYQAALEIERGGSVRVVTTRASMAKCFATDSAMRITTDAVQLLGGAGYIKDYGVERLMRDAKMLQIVEGTNQIQRWVIGRELVKDAI